MAPLHNRCHFFFVYFFTTPHRAFTKKPSLSKRNSWKDSQSEYETERKKTALTYFFFFFLFFFSFPSWLLVPIETMNATQSSMDSPLSHSPMQEPHDHVVDLKKC
ncbi:hypothetical protein DM01DRAFT_216725, partial [Hesseltinella vesiculosa]